MKREYRNYVIILICSTIIILLFIFHYIETINYLLLDYNRLVRWVNKYPDFDYFEKEVWFFGFGLKQINFLVDVILVFIVILICLLIFLMIYWTVQDNQKSEGKKKTLLEGEIELELVKNTR